MLPFVMGLGPTYAKADPISDLRSLSVFQDADLGRLSSGSEILAARGPSGGLGRALTVESAFVVHAPVKQAVSLFQQSNPVHHPELKVYLQNDLPARASTADFEKLGNLTPNASIRNFVELTQKLPGSANKLQLTKSEVQWYTPQAGGSRGIPAGVTAFWAKVLAERYQAFLAGGVSDQPPYETAGGVRPGDDLARLVKDSKIKNQFSPILQGAGLEGGRSSLSPSPYWTVFDTEGTAAVSLGATYWAQGGNGSQGLDLQYYSSGGLYALITLYQLWPITVGGQEATLVWRVDALSAPSIGELRGVERLGSGAAYIREVQKGVRAFLRDTPRGR